MRYIHKVGDDSKLCTICILYAFHRACVIIPLHHILCSQFLWLHPLYTLASIYCIILFHCHYVIIVENSFTRHKSPRSHLYIVTPAIYAITDDNADTIYKIIDLKQIQHRSAKFYVFLYIEIK